MPIIKGRINWMESYGNHPFLEVLVDRVADPSEFVFERRDPGLYYGLAPSGEVRFFSWSGRSGEGYGGRHFPITMKDGTREVLRGPWSSRASAMHLVGFDPCVEVSITDDPAAYERGHTFSAGSVSLSYLNDYLSVIDTTRCRTRAAGDRWDHFTGEVNFPAGSRVVMSKCFLDGHCKEVYPGQTPERPGNGEFLFIPTVRLPNGEIWHKDNR